MLTQPPRYGLLDPERRNGGDNQSEHHHQDETAHRGNTPMIEVIDEDRPKVVVQQVQRVGNSTDVSKRLPTQDRQFAVNRGRQ